VLLMSYLGKRKMEMVALKPGAAASVIQRAFRRSLLRKRLSALASRGRAQRALNMRTGGFLGLELKFVDYGYAAALVAPTDAAGGEADPATALALNAIAQGDGQNQRDGRKATIKSCYVSGQVTFSGNADEADAGSAPIVYIALVQDTQTNGAQLNSEDVFTNPAANALTAASPFRDLQYSKRFRVLDSCVIDNFETIAFPDGANTGSINASSKSFKLSWKGTMQTIYVGTTAEVSAIGDNSIHVIAYCSSTTFAPSLIYNSRVRFMG